MPPKKKNACPSINPKLYEQSMKPSMTLAMGMKSSHGASSCWRAQVEAERRIHDTWSGKYNPGEEQERVEALEHTLQRQTERTNAYRANNDPLFSILYRKDDPPNSRSHARAYLDARRDLSPQQKYTMPQTSAQTVGWSVPEAMRSNGHFSSSRLLNQEARMQRWNTAYRRPDDSDHAELFGYTLQRSY